ncbi:hypothetical protein K438DRAFT_2006908 [Mycena galopus ATCC 62051]|nr:hypothetical protein K438DRAFT_2006908 [Mycena galopus ATCC 62051]
MPSLFSRARTASTPSKSKHKANAQPPPSPSPYSNGSGRPELSISTPVNEFGVAFAGQGGQFQAGFSTPTRPHTIARSSSLPPVSSESGYGAVGFLPTTLPVDTHTPWAGVLSASTASMPPNNNTTTSLFGAPAPPRPAYGLLSPARDAVLGLPDLARLVAVLCAELERTGMSTPFIFSSLALDVRRSGVVRLVNAFLATCTDGNGNGMGRTGGHDKFVEEARFAGAHELGMALRWGLSRVVRVEGGREVRGLLSWAWYERWRAEESASEGEYGYWRVGVGVDGVDAMRGEDVDHRPRPRHRTSLVSHFLFPILFRARGP